VEVFLIPEVHLVVLLHVQSLISKGSQVEVTSRGKHFPTRLEELLGVEECLQHPLVEQHVAHGLGDDHIHLFRNLYLLDLSADHLDDVVHLVRRH